MMSKKHPLGTLCPDLAGKIVIVRKGHKVDTSDSLGRIVNAFIGRVGRHTGWISNNGNHAVAFRAFRSPLRYYDSAEMYFSASEVQAGQIEIRA
jgi:hypothetical protein